MTKRSQGRCSRTRSAVAVLEKLTDEYEKLSSTRYGLLDDPSIILEPVWTVAYKEHEGQMQGLLAKII